MKILFSVFDKPRTYRETIFDTLDGLSFVHVILFIVLVLIAITYYFVYKVIRNATNSKTIVSANDRVDAVVVQNGMHERLEADFAEMIKRQERTDTIIAKLLADRENRNGIDDRHCCAHFNALKADLDKFQKSNEKLLREHEESKLRFEILEKSNDKVIRKLDKLKLRLGITEKSDEKLIREHDELRFRLGCVERNVTTNSSVILGGRPFRREFPACRQTGDEPTSTFRGSYADGNSGRPAERYAAAFSVDTNEVHGSAAPCPSSSSSTPPPPKRPPTSCPSPLPLPPPPPQCSTPGKPAPAAAADVTDAVKKPYGRIPITEEILKSVVLRKPGDVPRKIKLPVGVIQPSPN